MPITKPPAVGIVRGVRSSAAGGGGGGSTYQTAVLATTGLACYLRLGEPSGTNANDETVNNNDGTYTTCTLAQTGATTDGNTAVSVGNTGKIEIPSGGAMPLGSSDCTVECFIYPTAVASYGATIDATGRAVHLYLNPAGNMSNAFCGFTGGSAVVALSTPFTLNAWQHIALVRRSPNVEVWRNGVLLGTGALSGAVTLTTPLTFGTNPGGGAGRYEGLYDEIAVYTVAVPGATITAHYAAR